MAAKLFVGNLSFRTTRDEIEGLFAQCGTIKDLFLPTDAESGRLRGFAFVEYESEDDAARAMEKFNGYELGGRALRVNAAEERPPRRPGFTPRMPSGGGGGGGGDRFGGGGGGGGGAAFGGGKSKGSRRNIRAKKRQL